MTSEQHFYFTKACFEFLVLAVLITIGAKGTFPQRIGLGIGATIVLMACIFLGFLAIDHQRVAVFFREMFGTGYVAQYGWHIIVASPAWFLI